LLIDSLLTLIVESTYLNIDMCKFESSQNDENRAQSVDSKASRKLGLSTVDEVVLGIQAFLHNI